MKVVYKISNENELIKLQPGAVYPATIESVKTTEKKIVVTFKIKPS